MLSAIFIVLCMWGPTSTLNLWTILFMIIAIGDLFNVDRILLLEMCWVVHLLLGVLGLGYGEAGLIFLFSGKRRRYLRYTIVGVINCHWLISIDHKLT